MIIPDTYLVIDIEVKDQVVIALGKVSDALRAHQLLLELAGWLPSSHCQPPSGGSIVRPT